MPFVAGVVLVAVAFAPQFLLLLVVLLVLPLVLLVVVLLVLLLLVFVLRVNLSAFLLGLVIFTGFAYLLDPLFHSLGLAILTAPNG